MQNLSEQQSSGRVSQQERILALATRLSAVHGDVDAVYDVCAAFDMSAEFAACEGRSIAEACREFFADCEPAGTRWGDCQAALRGVLGWDRSPEAVRPAALPVLPSAAMKLLRIDEDAATVADLESVAGSDPVMAAQILGAANSARFGSRYEISVVTDAIQRIGIPAARKTLLAACFSGLFISRPLQEIWAHSQLVADFAWQFAGLAGVDRGTAYSAGLLHDIGRLLLLRGPARELAAEADWLAAGFPLVYAETLARGTDHAVVGAELLAAWKLPESLVDAVRWHHRPESTGSTLAHILFLAEDLTSVVEQRAAEDLWTPMRRQVSLERSGISQECLAGLMACGASLT